METVATYFSESVINSGGNQLKCNVVLARRSSSCENATRDALCIAQHDLIHQNVNRFFGLCSASVNFEQKFHFFIALESTGSHLWSGFFLDGPICVHCCCLAVLVGDAKEFNWTKKYKICCELWKLHTMLSNFHCFVSVSTTLCELWESPRWGIHQNNGLRCIMKCWSWRWVG